MKKEAPILLLILLFLVPITTYANSDDTKYHVMVSGISHDYAGGLLIQKFKEAISSDDGLLLVSDPESAYMVIIIDTIEYGSNFPGHATIFSVTWIDRSEGTNIYRASTVDTCGINNLDKAVSYLIEYTNKYIDNIVNDFVKKHPELFETEGSEL